MSTLSIVVPLHNEREALRSSWDELSEAADQLTTESLVDHVDIIFIDDGSTDGSAALLMELQKAHSHETCTLTFYQFSRNFGHSAAVLAGLEKATGDYIAIIDADMQDPPHVLIGMLKTLQSRHADVVYGKRVSREGETIFKKATAWLFYRTVNFLSGTDIPTDTGDFRVLTAEVRNALISLPESEPFIRGLVSWVGFRQIAYPYERRERQYGYTKYTWKKMFRFATLAILSFSSLPLRMAIYLGIAGLGLSAWFAAHALKVWAEGIALPGWTSLVIGFTFAQSITLFVIGVMGLYLGRTHEALQNRPRYILREKISCDED